MWISLRLTICKPSKYVTVVGTRSVHRTKLYKFPMCIHTTSVAQIIRQFGYQESHILATFMDISIRSACTITEKNDR